MYNAPETASSTLEALQQRLQKYKSEQADATEAGNASKAKRHGRIVKQYEAAIKDFKKGKPLEYDELPTPPGMICSVVYFSLHLVNFGILSYISSLSLPVYQVSSFVHSVSVTFLLISIKILPSFSSYSSSTNLRMYMLLSMFIHVFSMYSKNAQRVMPSEMKAE